MSEDITNDAPQQPAAEPAPSAETKNPEKAQEHMIPKSRLDEVLQERKDLADRLAELEKARRDEEEAQKAKQGEFKELWEKAQNEAREAREKLEQLERDALRRNIATEAGFPALWNRISGDTEDALKADMASLVEALPSAKAPDIAGATGKSERGAGKKQPGMTKAEKQRLAGLLGVQAEYIP